MEEKLPAQTPASTPVQETPAAPAPVEQTSTKPAPKSKKGLLLVVGLLILIVAGAGAYFFLNNKSVQAPDVTKIDLHTYFSYTNEELQSLTQLKKSDHVTTIDDLTKSEEEVYTVVSANKDVDPTKMYAYLSVAKRDALLITRSMHNEFYGDTSALTHKILCEFYSNECAHEHDDILGNDTYSAKLADIILQKVKQRIAEDAAQTKNYTLKNDQKHWHLTPQIGLDMGSYKTWLIEKGDQFRVPENPDFAVQNFKKELPIVKTALANITSEQRKAVIFWAGGPGTKTPPGIWLDIVGGYMLEKGVSVEKYVNTQALLSMAMTDSLIGCFDSKYTHLVKRPYLVDPTIKTVMPTPNHPSYPAGHACVSNAAATILEKELPENAQEWQRMAVEASDSRTWGGIHFPSDNVQGTILGKSVGEYALTRFSQL